MTPQFGTKLAEIIARETGEQAECSGCQNEIARLNTMTAQQIIDDLPQIIAGITARASQNARTWWQRWACKLAPGLIEAKLNDWIREALATAVAPAVIERRRQQQQQQRPKKKSIATCFRYSGGEIKFIRSADFQEHIKILVGKIPPNVTAVAGVARSGLSAATMISMYLHLPMITIRQTMQDIVQTGNGWRLGGSKHVDPATERVVVIDDTCMTGNSIKHIRPLLDANFKNYLIGTVYCNPTALVKPDIFAVELGWPHLLEWNMFNSIISPTMAVDFDGVLCRDCDPWQDDDGPKYDEFIRTAVPLYTPRRSAIPLIVTARIEKYRRPTEEWLVRHGIRWNKLVMHPAKTLQERMRTDIAGYKARHFSAWVAQETAKRHPGPHVFVESDDRQAQRIGKITGMLTICPHTGNVYS